MAACEKVCEFSGEYPGHEMYNFKRNHIQIMPKFRKEFRGHKATLHIFEEGLQEVHKWYKSDAQLDSINPNPTDADWDTGAAFRIARLMPWGKKEVWSVFFENMQEYKEALKNEHCRLLMEYAYILEVPTVPGQTKGMYLNFSTDLTAVKRRLGRLVGKKNLTIIKHTCTMSEFNENQ